MPGITPSHWLPLVVIRVITNLSYTMQRYDFFLIYASTLANIFMSFSLKIVNQKQGTAPQNYPLLRYPYLNHYSIKPSRIDQPPHCERDLGESSF